MKSAKRILQLLVPVALCLTTSTDVLAEEFDMSFGQDMQSVNMSDSFAGGGGMPSGGAMGSPNHSNSPSYIKRTTGPTDKQAAANTRTEMGLLTKGAGGYDSLPKTVLDSFVKTCGSPDTTFGDEGWTYPPYLGDFTYLDTCGSATQGTGHASGLPSAWGTPQ